MNAHDCIDLRLNGVIVFNGQRCVVTKAFFFIDIAFFGACSDPWGSDVVINTPARVVGPSLTTVAPPGVGLARGLRVELSIDIDPTKFVKDLSQPGAFLRSEEHTSE